MKKIEIETEFRIVMIYRFKDDFEGWKLDCSIVGDKSLKATSNLENSISNELLTISECKECFNELMEYLKEANNG